MPHLDLSAMLDIVRPECLLEDVDVCRQVLGKQLCAGKGDKQAVICPCDEVSAKIAHQHPLHAGQLVEPTVQCPHLCKT